MAAQRPLVIHEDNAVGEMRAGDWVPDSTPGAVLATPQDVAPAFETCDTAWDDYYLGGEGALDTVVKVRGTGSLRITATGASTVGCSRELPAPVALDGLRMYVRVSDWSAVTTFVLVLASDSYGLADTLTVDIGTRLQSAPDAEWIEVVVPASGFAPFGSPDRSAIDLLLVRVVASAPVQVWVDDLAVVPAGAGGLVTITFDDGYVDTATIAKPLLDAKGFAAAAFIDPQALDTPGFMSQAQVDDLAYCGWDIGGHVLQNLTTLPVPTMERAVAATREWLNSRGLRGRDHFALPNGAYNDDVLRAVSRHFATAANIDGWNNPARYIAPYRVNRQGVDRYTTPAMIEQWVQDAVANGEWCVLTFHTLVDTLADDQDYLTSDFATVLDNIAASGAEVVTVSQALRRLNSGVQSGEGAHLIDLMLLPEVEL